jgi:hypothetical protein
MTLFCVVIFESKNMLDAKGYWEQVGRATVQQLCDECGTSYNYFKHIANKRKRPGVDLARKMVAVSQNLTPDFPLSLDLLLTPGDQMRTNATEKSNSVETTV